MKNEFVPYDVALAMKELGFNEECLGWFRDKVILYGEKDGYDEVYGLKAPLYQQAFRWFRDNYHLHITITSFRSKWRMGHTVVKMYDTYEEAELACLRKLIEIVKENKEYGEG